MNNEQLEQLKSKLTATKKQIALVDGKLSEVNVPKWGKEFAAAAAAGDWQAVIEYATRTSWHGIAEQVRAALA